MREGLNKSRFVISICSDSYYRKFDLIGTGVQKESCIINDLNRSDFLIPVIKNNPNRLIPEYLKDIWFADFDNRDEEQEIRQIVLRIYGEDIKIIPFVSKNPFVKEIAHKHILSAQIQSSSYINPNFEDMVEFNYSNNNGMFTIGTGEYSFATRWSKASNIRIHAYSDSVKNIALVKCLNCLDELKSTEGLDFTSRVRTPKVGDSIVWINKYGNIANTRILEIKDDRADSKDKVKFEYRIYTQQI